eukprot:m.282812 g.282812  ORF g.282812 m.282812 type:complete len:596 (+) comp26995_c0_seq1:262-2049(+)
MLDGRLLQPGGVFPRDVRVEEGARSIACAPTLCAVEPEAVLPELGPPRWDAVWLAKKLDRRQVRLGRRVAPQLDVVISGKALPLRLSGHSGVVCLALPDLGLAPVCHLFGIGVAGRVVDKRRRAIDVVCTSLEDVAECGGTLGGAALGQQLVHVELLLAHPPHVKNLGREGSGRMLVAEIQILDSEGDLVVGIAPGSPGWCSAPARLGFATGGRCGAVGTPEPFELFLERPTLGHFRGLVRRQLAVQRCQAVHLPQLLPQLLHRLVVGTVAERATRLVHRCCVLGGGRGRGGGRGCKRVKQGRVVQEPLGRHDAVGAGAGDVSRHVGRRLHVAVGENRARELRAEPRHDLGELVEVGGAVASAGGGPAVPGVHRDQPTPSPGQLPAELDRLGHRLEQPDLAKHRDVEAGGQRLDDPEDKRPVCEVEEVRPKVAAVRNPLRAPKVEVDGIALGLNQPTRREQGLRIVPAKVRHKRTVLRAGVELRRAVPLIGDVFFRVHHRSVAQVGAVPTAEQSEGELAATDHGRKHTRMWREGALPTHGRCGGPASAVAAAAASAPSAGVGDRGSASSLTATVPLRPGTRVHLCCPRPLLLHLL